MNERIMQNQYNEFINKVKTHLPNNLSDKQVEELSFYAIMKLQEGKKEKIIFNPVDRDNPLDNMTPSKLKTSAANAANLRYTVGNRITTASRIRKN